eukprot:scaffold29459_cov33-Phaeocystis_antarctica.AAC.1
MEGRVEEGFDPWEMSDGLTNTFASEYWAAGSWEKATPTTGYCPLTSAKHTQLRVVVLATASFTANERAIQQANVERLARGNRATRSWDVVLYALNAIDNKHDEWLGEARRRTLGVERRTESEARLRLKARLASIAHPAHPKARGLRP